MSQSISQIKGNYFLLGGGDNYWHFLIDFIPRLACLKNLSCEEIKVIIPHNLPEKFFKCLKNKGIIVAPIIRGSKQILKKFIKKNDKIEIEKLSDVLFVPNLTGIRD